ncbi:hypothetical protein BGI12_00180 [Snodgrassella alvi]|nr:hypothetical protein BGH96_00510 [Snodgrassella alvi]ORF41860.1 hypothetical protein BGI12_00180 [Snodgrassella alvi]
MGVADNQEKSLTLSQGEVNALKKAIMYLKFSCEETESVMYAGSPLINSVFSKLLVIDDLGEYAIDFFKKRHPENEGFVLTKLDKLELENGRKFESEVRENSFRECLYPFSRK